jgi:hypothetical protein
VHGAHFSGFSIWNYTHRPNGAEAKDVNKSVCARDTLRLNGSDSKTTFYKSEVFFYLN